MDVNAQRKDRYKNFRFRVRWNGRLVAGISKVSALKQTTDLVEHRPGGEPDTSHKSLGQTHHPIILERGVTHDTEFEKWANGIGNCDSGLGAEVSVQNFRKDLVIEIYHETGQLALVYTVLRAWVSEFQVLPDPGADANAVAIQRLQLENEGWQLDYGGSDPDDASYTEPPF